MKGISLVAPLLLLAGCASMPGLPTHRGGGPVIASTQWRCPGGKSFRVSFTSDGANVAAAGHNYRLQHARSASGARYASGGIEYWERAGEASLHGAAGGPYEHCRH
ncbi:MAG TPA: MliC family protein [Caulobacterales bacterium]|nr:MliC family protein [Caulobacterales bacterium]